MNAPEATPKPAARVAKVLCWLAILTPLWVYLLALPRFGSLQNNDYFSILWPVVEGDRLSTDPGRWLSIKSNEHRSTVPALVYAANAWIFHGDNRTLSLFTLAAMGVVFALTYLSLPRAWRGRRRLQLGAGFMLAAFAFPPVAAHNVAMGFSGTQWCLANALVLGMLTLTAKLRPSDPLKKLLPIALFGLVGAFSYSTSLVAWPALLAGALWLGLRGRQLAGLVLAGGLTTLIYASNFRFLAHHPEPNTRDYGTLFHYLAVYLGSPFSREAHTAAIWGWLGLLAAIPLGILAFRSRSLDRRLPAPWVMLQIYALLAAVGTAVGRSGKGIEQALASRYTTLAALFWLGLLITAGLLLLGSKGATRSRSRRLGLVLLTAFIALALSSLYWRGFTVLKAFASRASRQPVAALALQRGYPDEKILTACITPQPQWLRAIEGYMRRGRHIPFHLDPPRRDQGQIDPEKLARMPHQELKGSFQSIEPLGTTSDGSPLSRISGWAYHPDKEVRQIRLLDKEGRRRAELVLGIHRGSIGKRFGLAALASGFEGYTNLDWSREEAKVYVRLKGEVSFHPLRPSRPVGQWLTRIRKEADAEDLSSEGLPPAAALSPEK